MIISVASGKGGTGKTFVATALALSLDREIEFVDCDVEGPNSALFLKPRITGIIDSVIKVPEIHPESCMLCGECELICAYNALAVLKKEVKIFEQLCHGCGGCALLCPHKAITEKNKKIGVIRSGTCRDYITFNEGCLDIGAVLSPPLIRDVKERITGTNPVIIDCPPGTTCPMIEAVLESDFCLLVTEPTPFGLNDLKLAVEVVRKINIPFGIIVNRAGVGNRDVYDYCEHNTIPILLEIPFKQEIAEGYSRGKNLIDIEPGFRENFQNLFAAIAGRIKEQHV